jgi:hemerythrin superfamily protein
MDAITFLKQEHNRFKKTLAAILKLSDPKKVKLKFKALSQDLLRHESMEEKTWYPVLRKNADLRSIIKHLVSEEKSAGKAIKSLLKAEVGLLWKLRFYKLKHDIEHHAKEEEQGLFPKARQVLTKTQLKALGAKMRKFKAAKKKS